MSNKLKKLEKALNKCSIDAEYDKLSDNSSEWVSVELIKDKKKYTIIFHDDGEVQLWENDIILMDGDETRLV